MIEWREVSDYEQHELVLDFAREIHIYNIIKYYILVNNLYADHLYRLFIEYAEDKTEVYILDDIATKFVKNNFVNKIGNDLLELQEIDMYRFKLVRIIPAKGYFRIDSFLRIQLKSKNENIKYVSLEEEL